VTELADKQVEATPLVGAPVGRVDGRVKVTGGADYPCDYAPLDLVYACLVRSTISAGRIAGIDARAAEASEGVLAVITHANAPKLHRGKRDMIAPPPDPPLQTDGVSYYGQILAVVVAESLQQASAAARLVTVDYERRGAVLDPADTRAKRHSNPYHLDMGRGDVERGLASADVVVEATYSTPEQAHNPIGLFATVAEWDGDALTVRDSTQNPFGLRSVLAKTFGIDEDAVRVLSPFVGGAFGAGLRVSHHTILAAVAARVVERPVRIVLTRPEMFTVLGRRPSTSHHVRIGATTDGTLVAIDHEGTAISGVGPNAMYPLTMGSVSGYACPNVSARDVRVELNIPPLAHMRAPGDAEGNYAIESALDELAYELGMDPIELRRRNHAPVHPQTGIAWSSKALLECYDVGAELFRWHERDPQPGSMRDGRWLLGWGFSGISYGHFQVECRARATLRRDGTAYVCSGTPEIGVGTWTVMTQLSAECLGLPLQQVEFDLGDTSMPRAALVGGSGSTVALGSAVHDACRNLLAAFLDLAVKEEGSPFLGYTAEDIVARDGRIVCADAPSLGESFVEVLERHGLEELSADGHSKPSRGEMGVQVKSLLLSHARHVGPKLPGIGKGVVPAGAFGARFVEVSVDPDLGLLRIRRVLSVIDAGRILNEKTARSQIIGGTIQGIGTAMFEDIATDAETGRVANATFGDYLVPVNADIPDMDVVFVGKPDPANPLGVKGVGEVGYASTPAAIANAVFHATGKRIRALPITIDQLL
jgi:xanthine dehydrogenase YagR molybdenum-binding subunit